MRSAVPSAVRFPEKASHIAVPMRVCVCGGGGGEGVDEKARNEYTGS